MQIATRISLGKHLLALLNDSEAIWDACIPEVLDHFEGLQLTEEENDNLADCANNWLCHNVERVKKSIARVLCSQPYLSYMTSPSPSSSSSSLEEDSSSS